MTLYEAWEMICNWLRNNPISKNNYRFDVNNDDEILCRNESDLYNIDTAVYKRG